MGNDIQIAYIKNDFLDGTKPFEEVYQYINDPFELDRQLEKMCSVAKECGVSNFKKMFGSYCQKMKLLKKQVYSDKSTNFDEQKLELKTGPWQADETGIYKQGPMGDIVACVHPILPVERLVNVDTNIEKLKIAYKKGSSWRNMIFEKRQLASASSIVALSDYGIAVTSENARGLVQYIHDIENLNYNEIPEYKSVSRLGWIGKNGFSPYADGLIFDGNISFTHFYNSVQQHGKYDKWIDFVKKIRKRGNIPAKIVLAASFASVLVSPCNCLPFFVHIWNGSGNGKTVALMLAASVWANPRVGEYIHTFDSTDVGQELSAGFVNSLPLILDELQIQKDKRDFDKTIYKLSEGVGRMRGAKFGGLQQMQTWKNCIITNGEAPITSAHSGSGAVNRIIEINTEGSDFFESGKDVADFTTKHYGHAGKDFIEKLMIEKNMEKAKNLQKFYFDRLSGKDITEKQIIAASLILTADNLINEWIFKDDKKLTVDELSKYLSTHSEVSADRRALDWLMDWTAQNNNKFIQGDNEDEVKETWGRINIDTIQIVRDIFNRACADNGYNPTSFLSWLKRNNLLQTEGRAYTKRTRIKGVKCQCVTINTLEPMQEGLDYTETNNCDKF